MLALRQSTWRNCGLCVGLYAESGASQSPSCLPVSLMAEDEDKNRKMKDKDERRRRKRKQEDDWVTDSENTFMTWKERTRMHPNRLLDTLIFLIILNSIWQFAAFPYI